MALTDLGDQQLCTPPGGHLDLPYRERADLDPSDAQTGDLLWPTISRRPHGR